MCIKLINYLFWLIVESAKTWHQTNPWLSPQSLPFKATTNFQRLHQKFSPNNLLHLLAHEPQEEEPQKTAMHRKCNCDASCELAQKQVQYSQTRERESNEVHILAKANKTNRRLVNPTAKKPAICKSNRMTKTAASHKSNHNDELAMRCEQSDHVPWLGQHKSGQ